MRFQLFQAFVVVVLVAVDVAFPVLGAVVIVILSLKLFQFVTVVAPFSVIVVGQVHEVVVEMIVVVKAEVFVPVISDTEKS